LGFSTMSAEYFRHTVSMFRFSTAIQTQDHRLQGVSDGFELGDGGPGRHAAGHGFEDVSLL